MSSNTHSAVNWHLRLLPGSDDATQMRIDELNAHQSNSVNAEVPNIDVLDSRHLYRSSQAVELPDSVQRLLIVGNDSSEVDINDIPFALEHPNAVEWIDERALVGQRIHTHIQLLLQRGRPNESSDPFENNAARLLELAMQYSTDWMVFKDLDHRFRLASQNFCNAKGMLMSDIIGKNDIEIGTSEELVLGDEKTGWVGFWPSDDAIVASGETQTDERRAPPEFENGYSYERTDRVPLKDASGNVFGLMVCVSECAYDQDDATGEADLIRRSSHAWEHRSSLDHSPMLMRLADAKRRAERKSIESHDAYVSKNKFIASTSHDLRQPLHAMGLFIDSLERQVVDPDSAFLVSKIKQCSEALNELLNSLLDISRLDANVVSVDCTHFEIGELLRKIHEEHQPRAEEKQLSLHTNYSDQMVYSDYLLLGRILRNLIDNAIAHTERGSINVTTELLQDQLLISISDTGPGIPQNQHEAIFDEYHQLHNPERDRRKGLGLGLAIVRRLCALLTLDIDVASAPGQGSRFSLAVPLGKREPMATVETADPATRSVRACTIMVIDDDASVREAMQAMLQMHGCATLTAESASIAIEQIRALESLPDILLVDYRLRDNVTGDQAITEVREAFDTPFPAAIITGDTAMSSLRLAAEAGCTVLNKPVRPDVLLKCINTLLETGAPEAFEEPA